MLRLGHSETIETLLFKKNRRRNERGQERVIKEGGMEEIEWGEREREKKEGNGREKNKKIFPVEQI